MPKPIDIYFAVITSSEREYERFKDVNEHLNLKRVKTLDDIRGRWFGNYILLRPLENIDYIDLVTVLNYRMIK